VDCISLDEVYVHDPVELEAAKEKARGWARERRRKKLETISRMEARIEAGQSA
jgi:hypothetical protein